MKTPEQRREWGLKGAINRWAKEPPPDQRFWSKVHIRSENECWHWTGSKLPAGYGKTTYRKKYASAHRLAYLFSNGPIPNGICVCHHCDNPPCCNPKHLFLGTSRENTQDSARKGRRSKPKGEASPNWGQRRGRGEECVRHKLKQYEVDQIREEYANTNITQKELSIRFAIGQDSISRIISRKRWDC